MGSPVTTQKTESSAWQPAQGALKDVLSRAGQLSQNTDAFAATNRNQADALSSWAQSGTNVAQAYTPIAAGSAQGYNQGLDQLMQTSAGDGSYINPYAKSALNFAMDETANKVDGLFAGAGRTGYGEESGRGRYGKTSGASHVAEMTRQLGGLSAGYMTNLAENERGRQLSAANTLHSGGYQGIGAAQAVDAEQAKRAQAAVQAAALVDQDVNAQKAAPMAANDWYAKNVLSVAGTGQQGTSTSRTSPNTAGMIGSGIQMAAGLATGNPWSWMSGRYS